LNGLVAGSKQADWQKSPSPSVGTEPGGAIDEEQRELQARFEELESRQGAKVRWQGVELGLRKRMSLARI
jgi:hypothetical protein